MRGKRAGNFRPDFRPDSAFRAGEFVDSLLRQGKKEPCDDRNGDFRRRGALPPFYDEEKFKRGQRFFHDHIFAMFFTKILGLITILAVPDLVRVLKFTRMSDAPMKAYKRYLSTIFHMYVWYQSDFAPGSSLWQSIANVRNKHNSVSRRCCGEGLPGISQKNMALTQFGFMGYAVVKTDSMGIHNAKKEDLEAFVHVWRVIGYLMGIEDRFNICRESLDETRRICQELIDRVFKPEVEKNHADYMQMSSAMISGMWSMMPALEPAVFLHFIAITVGADNNNNNNNNNNDNKSYGKLNIFQRFYVHVIVMTLYTLKYTVCRFFHKYNMYLCLWFMENFPFLAYYRFGKINSHVSLSEPVKFS